METKTASQRVKVVESEDDPFLFLENPKVGVGKRFIVGLRRLLVEWFGWMVQHQLRKS